MIRYIWLTMTSWITRVHLKLQGEYFHQVRQMYASVIFSLLVHYFPVKVSGHIGQLIYDFLTNARRLYDILHI